MYKLKNNLYVYKLKKFNLYVYKLKKQFIRVEKMYKLCKNYVLIMYKSVCNSCKNSQTTKMTCHISPRFGIVSIVKVFVGSNFQLRSRILKFVSPSRSVMVLCTGVVYTYTHTHIYIYIKAAQRAGVVYTYTKAAQGAAIAYTYIRRLLCIYIYIHIRRRLKEPPKHPSKQKATHITYIVFTYIRRRFNEPPLYIGSA